jgi:hypothetical protein
VKKIALLAVLAGFVVGAGQGTAQASSLGCTYANPMTDPSYFCSYVSGSGNWVSYVSGTFRGSAVVCNPSFSFSFYDRYWNRYQTINAGTHWGCTTGDGQAWGINAWKSSGYMCSTVSYTVPYYGSRHSMTACNGIG